MSSHAVPESAQISADSSPWRFLEPLEENQAADRELIELTRSEELRIVGDMVATSRVSLLYAFSGNGKSSLINAGLIPLFRRRRGYVVFKTRPRPPWSIHDPVCAFKDCVLQGMELPLFSTDEMQKIRELRRRATALDNKLSTEIEDVLTSLDTKLTRFQLSSPDSQEFASYLRARMDLPLVQFIAEIQEHLGPETRFLFICDQFEELFVHYQNTPEADRFVRELGEVWANDTLKVHFLFSLREDWVGSMIAFRRAIPEIFASYYRLAPLTCHSAAMVLKQPLEQKGLAWDRNTVSVLLDDLALAYSENQADRFNGINLTPSPANDPYIELPALQILADEFWRTRHNSRRPFSLEHYRSLLGPSTREENTGPNLSPAQYVLDGYLKRRLDSLPESEDTREAMEDLRVECLYALTDRSRHRRALIERVLVEEVNRLRSATLELDNLQFASVELAMQPLVESHLVKEHETSGGQKEFELAHDFAVRSVVQLWRDLDRKRTGLLALRRQERERQDAHLASIAGRERRVLQLLEVMPFAAVLGLLTLVATLILGDSLPAEQLELLFGMETLVLATIATVCAGIALVSRRGLASAVLLAVVVGVNAVNLTDFNNSENNAPWIGSVRLPATLHRPKPSELWRGLDLVGIEAKNSTTLNFASSESLWGGMIGTDNRGHRLRPNAVDSDLFGHALEDVTTAPGFHWIMIQRWGSNPDIVISNRDAGGEEPHIVALEHFGQREHFGAALVLGGLAIFVLVAALRNFVDSHSLVGGSKSAERIGRVLLAELVDVLLNLGAVAALWPFANKLFGTLHPSFSGVIGMLVSTAGFVGLLQAGVLHFWRKTPGLALAALRIDGTRPGIKILLVRELLLAIWSVCNLAFGIPILILTPLIVRFSDYGQNFYDTWAHTRLVDSKNPSQK